ncbi:uncharacterized protein V1516DRAFT_673917 [Lipomyces oligophaga]|uniref:uncharacterized protein n=1 Tax=Lipomyces oligophaga TaxID=45792 RepID=UPI0034CF9319
MTKTLSILLLQLFLIVLSSAHPFSSWLTGQSDVKSAQLYRRSLANDTIINGTSAYNSYNDTVTANSSLLTTQSYYTSAIAVQDVTTTLSELITLYVTRTVTSSDDSYVQVSPKVLEAVNTATYEQTVGKYLATVKPTSTVTITITEPFTVMMASPTASSTAALSTSFSEGSYLAESNIIRTVVQTVTRTLTYTATVTESDFTKYPNLVHAITNVETEYVVEPTSTMISVSPTVYDTTITTSTVFAGASTSGLDESATLITEMITITSEVTSLVTLYQTITQTQVASATAVGSADNSSATDSAVKVIVDDGLTTYYTQYSTLYSTFRTPIQSEYYEETTTIIEYVTVDSTDVYSSPIITATATSKNSTAENIAHYRLHRLRQRSHGKRLRE